MSDEALRRLLRDAPASNDPATWLQLARQARRVAPTREAGLRAAASALDRAYGLSPDAEDVVEERREVLDALEVQEHGLVFRYVPAGPFLMGSSTGEPDESPVHERHVDAFWIADVPVSWALYAALMEWTPPPGSWPPGEHADVMSIELGPGRRVEVDQFLLNERNKIRWRYCDDRARGAAADDDDEEDHDEGDPTFEAKPMVAVAWDEARWLGERLSSRSAPLVYRLPNEAEWEKAARGGRVQARYAWGDEPPAGRCDFDRFEAFSLETSRRYPPNGYGLYAMCGGVWEWTEDDYDRDAYLPAAERARVAPPQEPQKVLRGGSWADAAEVVTVSYRMGWSQPTGLGDSPNIGFRLVRVER